MCFKVDIGTDREKIIQNVIDNTRKLQAHFEDQVYGVGLAIKPMAYFCFKGFENSVTRDLMKDAVGEFVSLIELST